MTLEAAFRTPPTDMKTLGEIARVAAEASGARRVVLFGSVARSEAGPQSDLDLLLVFDDDFFGPSPTFFEFMEPAGRAGEALLARGFGGFNTDLMPMKLSDLERGGSVLARAVQREGVTLFERPALAPRAKLEGPTLLERFVAAYEARHGAGRG